MVKNLVKFVLVFSLILGLSANPASTFAAEKETVNYVGLGDSLAAGRTPTGTEGKGYTDFIAGHFKEAGSLKTFNKSYAVSGYTTQNVLDDLTANVKKGDSPSIQAVVSQATHVTLDAGANDLLHQITVDRTTGKVSFDEAKLQEAMAQVQQNLTKTILTVKTLNPNAKVYLMGYYNPFPYLPEEYQATLNNALISLNSIIKQVAVYTGSIYVATDQTISGHKDYLSNPLDIHVTEDGYKAIANLFWNVMKPKMENVTPVVYWEKMILKKGQTGMLTVDKSINLWKRVDHKLELVRVLQPGEKYRVYGFDQSFGGQFSVGGGFYITKMKGHVTYKTPSKDKLKLVNQ